MQTEAQGVLIGPGPAVSALRTVFGELLQDPATVRRIAELISGADIRYPHTSGWAPDLTVDSGRGPVRLAELMRTGRPLLLDLTGGATESAPPGGRGSAGGLSASGPGGRSAAILFARLGLAAAGLAAAGRRGSRPPAGGTATGGLAEIARPWRDRVDIVTGRSDDAPSAGMLIRPDGYVAWDSASAEPLTAALTRWWGSPGVSEGAGLSR